MLKFENLIKTITNESNDNTKYKIYHPKKKTDQCSDSTSLSEKELAKAKKDIKKYKEKKDYIEIKKNSEMKENISECKEKISMLGKKLGVDLKKRLINDKDIHLLSEKEYTKKFNDGNTTNQRGIASMNDIFLKKDFHGKHRSQEELKHTTMHELIHTCTARNIFIKKNEAIEITSVSVGYGRDRHLKERQFNDYNSLFRNFNEGLTELTAIQLLSNDDFNNIEISYEYEVILISEIVKDLSKNTKRTNEEEVLSQFQTGMFKSKRGFLKIISDCYGNDALIKLGKMTIDDKSAIEVAKSFGLEDIVKEKIEKYSNGEIIEINIGNNEFKIKSNNSKK